jgi:predicted ATPase
MADGCSNQSVGRDLGLALKTVEASIRSIFQRLQLPDDSSVNRRVLAVRWFLDRSAPSQDAIGRSSDVVGRVVELNQLSKLMDTHRLISIVGAGGMGKTRLARELAARATRGRVILVDLAGSDELSARQRVFEGFGLRIVSEATAIRVVKGMLDVEPYLVVLDNAEHVVPAVTGLVPVLTAADQTRLVVTSRQPLDVSGEYLWRIPPLNEQDSLELLARRLEENGSPDRTEPGVMARWCAALDGMPLAIELAASRLSTLPADEFPGGGDELPAFLRRASGSPRAGLDEVLGDSFRRLPAESRDLARSLAPFRGGFTLEAVRAVALIDDVELAVSSLVRSGLAEFSAARYRMLEPVRQFVVANTARANRDSSARGLVTWCAHLAEAAELGYPHDPVVWHARIEAERDNLDAALEATVTLNAAAEAVAIVRGMWPYWYSGASATAYQRAVEILDQLQTPKRSSAWGWVSIALGRLAANTRARVAASRHLAEALACFESLGDAPGIAAATCWKARHDGSRAALMAAARLAAEAGSPEVEGWAWLTLARDDMRVPGDHILCLQQLDRAAQIARLHAYPKLAFNAILLRAEIMLQANWLDQARFSEAEINRLLDQAGRFSQHVGAALDVNDVLSVTTSSHLHHSRWKLAARSVAAQLEYWQRTEDRVVVAEAVLMAAVVLWQREQRDLATRLAKYVGPTFADWSQGLWLAFTLFPANDLYSAVSDEPPRAFEELLGSANIALNALRNSRG